jgi:hypothetical protein
VSDRLFHAAVNAIRPSLIENETIVRQAVNEGFSGQRIEDRFPADLRLDWEGAVFPDIRRA